MKDQFYRIYNNKWAISIISGILLGLSFPPFPFPFLMIPALLGLFRLMDLTETGKELAYVSYAGFLIWNIIGTYWLSFATIPGGIAAILANSALMTIPLALMRYIHRSVNSHLWSTLFIAAAWVAYEFLHHRWDLSWPWLTLGNGFSNAVMIIQYISITGVLGISFWLVAASYLIYRLTLNPSRSLNIATPAVLFGLPVISLVMYFTYEMNADRTVETAILQPNYDSYEHMAGYPDAITPLNELLEKTDSIITDNTEVIFWPENALQESLRQGYRSELDMRIERYVEDWQTPLITGTAYVVQYDQDEAPIVTRGEFLGMPYNIFNAAVAFYPGDRANEHYEKAELVPFVERFPFIETIARLDIITNFDWGSIAGYGRGNEPTLFDINGTKVPALICYDSVYPEWVSRFVRDGAGMITVITNDGWWGETSGHIQHYDYARLRAIENRRTTLRSANNGISGVILPNGDVEIRTEYWTRDGFVYDVPVSENMTLYTRYGDWLGRLSVILTFGMLGYIIRRRYL